MTARTLLLAVVLGLLVWLLCVWMVGEDTFDAVQVKTVPSQQHAADVHIAQVSTLWEDLHTRFVIDEYLKAHKAAVELEAKRRAEARRKAAAPKAPVYRAASTPVVGGVNWDAIARCESGGRWDLNTGNGYYGGLQFALSSWRGVGGTGYPHHHSRETQIAMALRLSNGGRNLRHWPVCGRHG